MRVKSISDINICSPKEKKGSQGPGSQRSYTKSSSGSYRSVLACYAPLSTISYFVFAKLIIFNHSALILLCRHSNNRLHTPLHLSTYPHNGDIGLRGNRIYNIQPFDRNRGSHNYRFHGRSLDNGYLGMALAFLLFPPVALVLK